MDAPGFRLTGENGRPVVYDYLSPVEFLNDLRKFYVSRGHFSLRQRVQIAGNCSQALISQILRGHRQLRRDNLDAVAAVFKLTSVEVEFIDQQLRSPAKLQSPNSGRTKREAKNHLLQQWYFPYVKDLIHLRGFQKDPMVLSKMMRGLVPVTQISKAIEYLMREGFWRPDGRGQLHPEFPAVTTTNEIPNEKIRAFHKKALGIAARGIASLPVTQRKASTVLVSVDAEKLDELKSLIDSFQKRLLEFIETYPKGRDGLYQVTIHLTPIGEPSENR